MRPQLAASMSQWRQSWEASERAREAARQQRRLAPQAAQLGRFRLRRRAAAALPLRVLLLC